MINGYPVIDMQHHFIPSAALPFVGKTPEYDFATSLNRFRRAYEVMQNIDLDLKYMDASGIDMAILSTGSFTPNGNKFCKVCNNGYAEVTKKHPDRFRGMIHVYPCDPEEMNVNEIIRGVEDLGLWGLALLSSYGDITADSRVMDHLYEMAVRYDMPVFIHPTIRVNLWGGERYDLYTTMAREYDIVKSFVEIVYGVLPRFPALKVIMAHYGGGLPALKGRLLAWHQPKGYLIPEEDRGHGRSIDEAKELNLFNDFESRTEHVIFDSAGYGGWLPVIKCAFETLGSDHMCFATDYPFELKKPQYTAKILAEIDRLSISEQEKQKFLAGNVKRFFRL